MVIWLQINDIVLKIPPVGAPINPKSEPPTAGRLAACFDWGTAWPLRWSADLFLKLILGPASLLFVLSRRFRYSTSLLAISANRLARRPPAKTTDGRREAAPRCFVDEGGVLLSDLR